jgi:hypothetical protein
MTPAAQVTKKQQTGFQSSSQPWQQGAQTKQPIEATKKMNVVDQAMLKHT